MLAFLAIVAIVVGIPVGYLLYTRKFKKNTHVPLPQTATELEGTKTFTLEELAQYDGIKKPQVYLAVKDVVFDVSISPKYKPGASYAVFAGREVSVALAKMSFETEFVNVYHKTKLKQDEIATMEGWFTFMKERYPVVGQVQISKRDD